MARLALALLLLTLFVWTPTTITHAASYQQLLQRALALSQQKQWRASRAILEELATHTERIDPTVEAALAVACHQDVQFDHALVHYENVLAVHPTDAHTIANLGYLFYDTKKYTQAIATFERAIAIDPGQKPRLIHSMAVAYHYVSDFTKAEKLFSMVPENARTPQYHYDRGVTLSRLGKVMEAADAYNMALEEDQELASAWHNVAALHQQYGNIEDSKRCYLQVLAIRTANPDQRLMSMTNLAVAYEMTDDIRSALLWYNRAQHLVPRVQFNGPETSLDALIGLAGHSARAKRTACVWENYDLLRDELHFFVEHEQLARGVRPVLSSFDTLLTTMDPFLRLRIAREHSLEFTSFAKAMFGNLQPESHRSPRSDGRLAVGYISYDYTDHPTAHLLEGVLATHDRSVVHAIAFGYGKDDGSEFRMRLLELVDEFVNLVITPTEESVRAIRERRVDILMDAQGHTRGGRPRITAARPAPVVVNYLVYPGTSGADFVDYIVTDRLVTPPESMASHFSEKLVMLPRSYQANYYPQAVVPRGRASLWSGENKPDTPLGGFTFVNFNKIDKLEPSAFSLWMAILRRVPQGRLLLLNPLRPESQRQNTSRATTGDEIIRNLRLEAAAYGVASSRIGFVARVPKRDHLQRHRTGGLFLDTLVYGAHSTATDALYAGLPVLTLAGDSFASRVGVSLLTNAKVPELIVYSIKEFEDHAVSIATEESTLLAGVREQLRCRDDDAPPLFRTHEHVASLERAQRVMAELQRRADAKHTAAFRTAHIVIFE